MKLFVYGTLRRGHAAHGLLTGAGFVADVWSEPEFTLVDMGGYPALVEGGGACVRGEIYSIEPRMLHALDAYEDCPSLYQRVRKSIGGHDVFVYVLPLELAQGRPVVPHGDWCPDANSAPLGPRREQ